MKFKLYFMKGMATPASAIFARQYRHTVADMKKKTDFALLGGDARQAALGKKLQEHGSTVVYCGIEKMPFHDKDFEIITDIGEAVRLSKCVILPMPSTEDMRTIFAPFSEKTLFLAEVFAAVDGSQPVLGGRIPKKLSEMAATRGISVIDYTGRESFKVFNAIPTAEGAVAEAIRLYGSTIYGSKILVCGYGCIGSALSSRLKALGADVTVSARKSADLARIKTNGMKNCRTEDAGNNLKMYDIIFNTVPAVVLDEKALGTAKNGSLIIDLASAPGGVDFTAAEQLKIKAVRLPGLPFVTSPDSAAEIAANEIEIILQELNANE